MVSVLTLALTRGHYDCALLLAEAKATIHQPSQEAFALPAAPSVNSELEELVDFAASLVISSKPIANDSQCQAQFNDIYASANW